MNPTASSMYVINPEYKNLLNRVLKFMKAHHGDILYSVRETIKYLHSRHDWDFIWEFYRSGVIPWADEEEFNDFIGEYRKKQLFQTYHAHDYLSLVKGIKEAGKKRDAEIIRIAKDLEKMLPSEWHAKAAVNFTDSKSAYITIPAMPFFSRSSSMFASDKVNHHRELLYKSDKIAMRWVQASSVFDPYLPAHNIVSGLSLTALKVGTGRPDHDGKPVIAGVIVNMFFNRRFKDPIVATKLTKLLEKKVTGGVDTERGSWVFTKYQNYFMKLDYPKLAMAATAIQLVKHMPGLPSALTAFFTLAFADELAAAALPKPKKKALTQAAALKILIQRQEPNARKLVDQVGKDPLVAQAYVSDILEDANWHSLASELGVDIPTDNDIVSRFARDYSFSVNFIACFGIAVMLMVGNKSAAKIIKDALIREFGDELIDFAEGNN